MVTLPCRRRNVHSYQTVRWKVPRVCTSRLRAVVVLASADSRLGSPLLDWIVSLQEPSTAFIVHLYGRRKGQKKLQLRGSVLHMQKDLLPSASRQTFLAVLGVLSEWITGDAQCNVCALHCTVSLLHLVRRSCWLPPFHGNNLHARKEIAMRL